MKKNGNDKRTGDYYLGLDIGTDSVGWAAVDTKYNLLRIRGKDAWGVRLFDEGNTAEVRRINRTNRRRLMRRKWRSALLKELFAEEIAKVDAGFYQRMKESSRAIADRNSQVRYSLFADGNFTDKDYLKKYPTVYHLRKELIYDKSPHDVRLVYLAIHHIIKSRGHFLYSVNTDGDDSLESLIVEFVALISERFQIEMNIGDVEKIKSILYDRRQGKRDKLIAIKNCTSFSAELEEKRAKSVFENLLKLCIGSTVELNKLFYDVKFDDKVSVCVNDDENKLVQVLDLLGDDADIVCAAKAIYDRAMIESITDRYATVSEFKISQYQEHKEDIDCLKHYVKYVLKDKELAHEIFDAQSFEKDNKNAKSSAAEKQEGNKKPIANYAAYSRYHKGDAEGGVSQEEFCKYLKGRLGNTPVNSDEKYSTMFKRIEEGIFAPKLKTTENGTIPNSLHKKELEIILKNASEYLPFLAQKDENGLSIADKVIAVFDYKLPYFVGPLKNGWAVRAEGKEKERVLPWNFDAIIDCAASSERFIERMTSICTYTGEDVLPMDSLLYSEFCVLNEINNIKINGNAIDVCTKQRIFNELFVKRRKRVSKHDIFQFLKTEGLVRDGDLISGVDDTVKSGLRSYHDLKNIIEKTSFDTAEDIIRHVVLFGKDKSMLRNWLICNTSLCEDDIRYVCRLKYIEWGRLSKVFLTEICDIDKESGTGEVVSVIEMMRRTNQNLMQLLGNRYRFSQKAAEHKAQKLGICENPRQMVEDLYVSPKIRRAIWQALRISDEIIDAEKCAPKKIFIEVARDNANENKKGKRTASRKEQLLNLYKLCERQGHEFFDFIDKKHFDDMKAKLENEADANLMGKHLLLYYRQFGKCMYTGQPIELSDLKNKNMFDIDHIFPRSKIKDDSFDNLVLVKSELNRDKTNIYPIEERIRNRMCPFWKYLLDIGAISQKKYERLIRHTPLTEDELAEFINRQLVETRQSTKAVAEILGCIYGKNKIVYSKAENVSDFRDNFNILKCREVNDLHHAQDAYLNIVVGNYFDTRFTDAFRKNIINENYNLKTEKLYSHDVKGAWQSSENGTVETVRNVISKNSILYTRMPYEVKGQIFDVQPVKKKAGLIPMKKGEDTAVYGGYNAPRGAYWALVEHVKKQKKQTKISRSLEPVYILDKLEYEKDPQAFAKEHWLEKDDDIRVVIPKIMKHSLLEFDGARVHITGRTGDNLIVVHASQLYVPYDVLLKFRKISRYVDRCKKAGKALSEYESVETGTDTCLYLYDWIIEKLKQPTYKAVHTVCIRMEELRDNFAACSDAYIRCKALLQCLNALRCNAVYTNLKEIGGPANIGSIRLSKNISKLDKAYLINQSPAGLYEKKIDLIH